MIKKYFTSLFVLLISFSSIAQEKKEIITADVVTINSKILNEKRTAWVYNPGNKKESKTYPVIYVLDGESHFKSVVVMVEYLSGANVIPPMIIVGILHPNRMKDLTPTIEDTLAIEMEKILVEVKILCRLLKMNFSLILNQNIQLLLIEYLWAILWVD